MFLRRLRIPICLSLVLALASACGGAPPPPPAPPETKDAPEPQKAEAKPPPKCEALDEKCEAGGSTKARIAGAGALVFTPAPGWIYAQGSDVTVAQTGDSGPAVAAIGYETGDAKKEGPSRDASLDLLVSKLGVTPPKKKIPWKKPLETKDVGGLKVSLWQIEGGARGDKKGPLLVFAAPLETGTALLGIGFVPDDDQSNADAAILKSIESIAKGAKGDGAGGGS